ncbi:uncharacterized protein LOC117219216 isoform X1 [Megalopta genalis]|uniref:uncharacterized protein LOC117219216 isoform X1 n=1 Tax=Megalopta genalis TaxID=115081 RepID=UPI003FD17E97
MKYWNKKIEKRKNSKSGKRIKKPEKYQFVKNSKNHNTYGRFYVAPTDYVFYSIINTDLQMIRRTETALIIRSLIELYMILENDTGKSHYLETWFQNGKKIIILEGYDHKHLKYLQDEAKYMAIATHAVRRSWERNISILALAVFGVREELDEVFDGLSYLR